VFIRKKGDDMVRGKVEQFDSIRFISNGFQTNKSYRIEGVGGEENICLEFSQPGFTHETNHQNSVYK
jgi:hypothetical protein